VKALPATILIADDDEDDHLLIAEALAVSRSRGELHFVRDGLELLQYLRQEGVHTGQAPRPALILLDLHMPCMDGAEALRQIKASPELHQIPVACFSTSALPTDVSRSYALGASGYITKPSTFFGLVECMRCLSQYWLSFVELPGSSD
jgi:two-component system response regulator